MSLADDLKLQLEKLKLKPDQIYKIHNNIRTLTNRFDAPGPEMRDVLDFDVHHNKFPSARASVCTQRRVARPRACLIYLHGGGFCQLLDRLS